MEENTQITHNKENLCKAFGSFEVTRDGSVEIDYTGKIVIMSKETESRLYGKINSLTNENGNLKELNMKIHKANVYMKKKIADLQKLNDELNAKANRYLALYNQVNDELKKFKDNQGKGRASKLTDEMKYLIEGGLMKGYSITTIYEAFVRKGVDVSYETIRRYCAEIKARNGNLR